MPRVAADEAIEEGDIRAESASALSPNAANDSPENILEINNNDYRENVSEETVSIPQYITAEQGIGYTDSDLDLEIRPEFIDFSEASQGDFGEIYYGQDAGTMLTVEPKDDQSIQMVIKIPDRDSQTHFMFDIVSEDYHWMEVNKDGSISAFNSDGEFVFGVASPWATDSRGIRIPTWFEIEGKSIVQVVDHTSGDYSYPIAADPWLGKDLYSKVYVTYTPQGYVVNATPSTWGKSFVGIATWSSHIEEVKSKANYKWNPSIENQMKCHLLGFPLSLPEYNLESWRPNVNYSESLVKYRCNPGVGADAYS